MNTVRLAFGVASLAMLAGCVAPAATAADAPVAMRLLVELAQPSTDADALAREAAAAAGVPVRYLAAAGARWHALALQCASAPQCDSALQRLRSDTSTYAAVERDERKRPSVR